VAENMDDCAAACRLTFRYTLNTAYEDLIEGSVEAMDVYVFSDSTRTLVDVIEIDRGDIVRGSRDIRWMNPGSSTFVAWGVSTVEKSRSYSSREMVDARTHDHTGIEIGRTTLDELYMMLTHHEGPTRLEGGVVPVAADFDDVFHDAAGRIEIVEGQTAQVDFDLTRNTSMLKIAVTGLEHFPDPPPGVLPLRIYATGENGRYRWDNEIDAHAPLVYYGSGGHRRTGDAMALDIPMQRLHITRHDKDNPVLLHIEQTTDGSLENSESTSRPIPGIPQIDLVASIQEATDGIDYFPYETQESIDREEEFYITLALRPDPDRPGYYLMTMTINEWEVVIIWPDIEPK
jgi:hypothetical protein